MSRKIDVSDPKNLSVEDRLYLQQREGVPGGGLPKGAKPVHDPSVQRLAPPETEESGTATNDAPNGGAGFAPQTSADGADYANWSVKDLKAEVERRNEERPEDDRLEKPSKKDDLVAVLEADDEDDTLADEED